MEELLISTATFFISFFIVLFLVPRWILKAKSFGLVGKDMNKHSRPEVAEGGGIAVIIAVVFSLLFYVFLKVFYFQSATHLVEIFAMLVTLLLAGFIGFVDDILGWKVGFRRFHKFLLTIPIGIPLMVVNAGQSVMFVPFLGSMDFGLLYPLLLVPVGVIGAANGFNMLGGYNGLESGLGFIILSSLAGFAFLNGNYWISLVSLSGAGALLGFLVFNWVPARVFPGDSMTYSIGAFIAMVVILGNMEKIGVILFIPFILDAALSLWPEFRGRGKVEAFGKISRDNSIGMPYTGIHDMTHFAIWSLSRLKSKVYERDVTIFLWGFQLLMVLVALLTISM